MRGSGAVAHSGNESAGVVFLVCPNCEGLIVKADIRTGDKIIERYVWPFSVLRKIPDEVPAHIAADFREAAEVLTISPKASAALSRRCLQTLLREAGKSEKANLIDQISDVLPDLPKALRSSVDAIRNIGNFGAHPIKSTATGMIMDVEPQEAEWNLDILEELFDYYYVQPKRIQSKRDSLNAKLAEANKKPLKGEL